MQTLILRRRSQQRSPLFGAGRDGGRDTFRSLPGAVVAGPQLHASFRRGPDAMLLAGPLRRPGLPAAPAELCVQVLMHAMRSFRPLRTRSAEHLRSSSLLLTEAVLALMCCSRGRINGSLLLHFHGLMCGLLPWPDVWFE